MLDELQIASLILNYSKDLEIENQLNDISNRDDRILLTGIICGLLTALGKTYTLKIQEDLIKYSLEVVNEIFDKYK